MGVVKKLLGIGKGEVEILDFFDHSVGSESVEFINHYEKEVIQELATRLSTVLVNTYKKGVVHQGDNWYMWNVRPNLNQTSGAFLHQFFSTLLTRGEALIVPVCIREGHPLGFFVADTFEKNDLTLKERVFRDIRIKDIVLREQKREGEVVYMTYDRSAIDAFNAGFGALCGGALTRLGKAARKQGARKYTFRVGALGNLTQEQVTALTSNIRTFLNRDDDAALSLDGKITEFREVDGVAQRSGDPVDALLKLDELVRCETFSAFGISDASDEKERERNLVAAAKPIAAHFEDQLNSKLYSKKELLGGDRVSVVIPSNALYEELDTLIHTGMYSINDALNHMGRKSIAEPWADEHYMTKNYAPIKSMLDDNA